MQKTWYNRLRRRRIANAQRMFTSFMGYHDVQAFNYLMNEYREYLSAEQIEDILKVAKEAFVEDVWESYI